MKYYVAKNIGRYCLSLEEARQYAREEDICEVEEIYIVRYCGNCNEYVFSTIQKAIEFAKEIALMIIQKNERLLYKDKETTIKETNREIDEDYFVDMNTFVKYNYETISIYTATLDSGKEAE